MVNKIIQKWAEEKGLPVVDNTALMTSGEYLFTYGIGGDGTTKWVQIIVPLHEQSWGKEQTKMLRNELKKSAAVAYQKGYLRMTVSAMTTKRYTEKLETATRVLLDELPRLGAKPADTCKYCGEGDCDSVTLESAINWPAHTRCKEHRADEILAEIEHNQEHGSTPLGIIGAILGGVVGSIPTFLTAYYAGTLYAVLFFLIPIASYYGYRLFRGVMGRAVPIYISIISLLCTVLLVFAYLFADYAQSFTGEELALLEDLGLTKLELFLEDVISEENRGFILESMVQPVIFSIIGIIAAWSVISRNNKHKAQQVSQLVSK